MSGLGTDLAHHFLLSFIDLTLLSDKPMFVLFLDLAKAFDTVLRELVFGWPTHVGPSRSERVEHLRKCGADSDIAEWICDYVELHGTAFYQMGIDSKTTALVRELHTKSWFSYQSSPEHAATLTGGRQGCTLGGVVFNSAYALSLIALGKELRSCGIALKVRSCGRVFWANGDPDGDEHIVLEIAFVDDLCIVLTAQTYEALWNSIQKLLSVVGKLFRFFKMSINWNKGKTEAFCKVRGKRAGEFKAKLIHECGYGIKMDDGAFLHIVENYRHLGCVTCADASSFMYAKHRASSALSAYTPLAVRMFGNPAISVPLRRLLCDCLILSRATFNAHIRALKPRDLAVLNGVYMRVVRRIGDNVRFDGTACNDLAARRAVAMQSIDCMLLKKRLVYVSRLVRSECHPLMAMLACTPMRRGAPQVMPWTRLIKEDFCEIYRRSEKVRGALPHPASNEKAWFELMYDLPQVWKTLVNSVHFCESVCDRTPSGIETTPLDLNFKCDMCGHCFASRVALNSHVRAKHKIRARYHLFSRADCKCEACGKTFGNIPRLHDHWANPRRPECWTWIQAKATPMTADEAAAPRQH